MVALLVGIVIILFVAARIQDLQDLVAEFIARVGGAWGLGIVGVTTLLLWVVWVRYGGLHALRTWGVVLKPTRVHDQDDVATGPEDGTTVERPSQDSQALR